MKIPSLNMEHLGVEKYEFLLNHFNVNLLTCNQHASNFISDCSLYEVLLFGGGICDRICDLEKLEKILELYKK